MRECVTHHSACDCREALFEQIRARCERLEVALETAMTVLEQIASTPRNRGARRNASATTAFLRTQLNVQHNDNVTVHVPLATSAVVLDESTPCQGAGGNKAGGCERLQHETVSDIIADRDRLRAALLNCARQAEALKRDCGMSPESEQAVRNGQYQAISTTAHIALGTIRGPKGRDEAACNLQRIEAVLETALAVLNLLIREKRKTERRRKALELLSREWPERCQTERADSSECAGFCGLTQSSGADPARRVEQPERCRARPPAPAGGSSNVSNEERTEK